VKQNYESCIDFTVAMDPMVHSEVDVETDLSQKKLIEWKVTENGLSGEQVWLLCP
jgi:hypothetical protein